MKLLFPQIVPEMLDGVELWRIWRKAEQTDIFRDHNDGVADSYDKCPGTPIGVKVDQDGCPLDSDKDGVPDYLDKCPGTPGRYEGGQRRLPTPGGTASGSSSGSAGRSQP
jgi:hypothetical protein